MGRCQDEGPMAGFTLDAFGLCEGRPDTITLTTLHSGKGLEYEVVIIPRPGRCGYNYVSVFRDETQFGRCREGKCAVEATPLSDQFFDY